MRLTADVLYQAEQFTNAIKEREINLRGLNVSLLENLGVLQDRFDVMDLSYNELNKLDNFPRMMRLSILLCNFNNIHKISSHLAEKLSNLRVLHLANNRIENFVELEHLSQLTSLEHLILIDNPICYQVDYRKFIVFRFPKLKTLDFQKISKTEYLQAKQFYETNQGQVFLQRVSSQKRNDDDVEQEQVKQETIVQNQVSKPTLRLSSQQREEVRRAIAIATSKDQVDHIETQLRNGTFPFQNQ